MAKDKANFIVIDFICLFYKANERTMGSDQGHEPV